MSQSNLNSFLEFLNHELKWLNGNNNSKNLVFDFNLNQELQLVDVTGTVVPFTVIMNAVFTQLAIKRGLTELEKTPQQYLLEYKSFIQNKALVVDKQKTSLENIIQTLGQDQKNIAISNKNIGSDFYEKIKSTMDNLKNA